MSLLLPKKGIIFSRREKHTVDGNMSCYLSADVGFSILEDQSQVFNVVGLKEAVDLCLAGERGAHETLGLDSPIRVRLSLEETPIITNKS